MVHAQRTDGSCHTGDGIKWHQLASRRADVELLESARTALVLGLHFQDHGILIGRRIDIRNLSVPIGGIQRVLDLLGRDAKRLGPIALDVDVDLGTRDQQIAAHVGKSGQGADPVGEFRCPLVDVAEIYALNRHLIETGAELSIDRYRWRILKERHNSGHLVEPRPQRHDGFVHGKRDADPSASSSKTGSPRCCRTKTPPRSPRSRPPA